jgi:hypothetical protein
LKSKIDEFKYIFEVKYVGLHGVLDVKEVRDRKREKGEIEE